MKHELWQLNSTVLVIFTLILTMSIIAKHSAPISSPTSKPMFDDNTTNKLAAVNLEKIYKNDLFDTFSPEEGHMAQLITPIPQQKSPPAIAIPELDPEKIIDPLNIKLKGILYSSIPDKSVALILDETNKEKGYAIGEKIKDAQVIQISPEKVVLFRNNGQEEVMSLKEYDEKIQGKSKITWNNAIEKLDETLFKIDPLKFTKLIPNMASLIDDLSLVTLYKEKDPIGLRLGMQKENSAGGAIGLKEKDLITEVNDITVLNYKNRYQAFKSVINSKMGDDIKVGILRNNEKLVMNYKLENLPLFKKSAFERLKAEHAGVFTMNKGQQRSENQRTFEEFHPNDRKQLLESLRKRLIENIRNREQSKR